MAQRSWQHVSILKLGKTAMVIVRTMQMQMAFAMKMKLKDAMTQLPVILKQMLRKMMALAPSLPTDTTAKANA